MVLLTKEVFIQLKALINLHVNVNVNEYSDEGKQIRTEQWQVYIQGTVGGNVPPHAEMFQTYITVSSKDDAYRLFQELAKQVVDSGEVPDLNTKLVEQMILGGKGVVQ
jgi:hypothetical protein